MSGCHLKALKCIETYGTLKFDCYGCSNFIEVNYKNIMIKYKSLATC